MISAPRQLTKTRLDADDPTVAERFRALDEARRRGGAHLQLTVYVDNHRARRFYDRRGFAEVGRYDFMVGNHADEDIIMRKPL